MINNNPHLLPVFRCDSKGNKIEKDDRITRSPRMTLEQWEHLIKIMKEADKSGRR